MSYSRKKNKATPLTTSIVQATSDTDRLKNLVEIADKIAIYLSRLGACFQDPMPYQIRGMAERGENEDNIILLSEFQNSSEKLTNNNKVLMLKEAKKYLKKHHPTLKVNLKTSSSFKESLGSDPDKLQSKNDERKLDEESVIIRFSNQLSKLADFYGYPNFFEELQSKSSVQEKRSFLTSYFIETILSMSEIEKQFGKNHPNSESKILELLAKIKYAIVTKMRFVNSKESELTQETKKRLESFVCAENTKISSNGDGFQICLNITDYEKGAQYSDLPSVSVSSQITDVGLKLKNWNIISSYHAIAQGALEGHRVLADMIQQIKIEFSIYLELIEKCSISFEGLTQDEIGFLMINYDCVLHREAITLNLAEAKKLLEDINTLDEDNKLFIFFRQKEVDDSFSFLKSKFKNSYYFEEDEIESQFSSQSIATASSSLFSSSSASQLSNSLVSTAGGQTHLSSTHDYVGLSDRVSTFEYKKMALEKIQQMEVASQARKNRFPASISNDASSKKNEDQKSDDSEQSDLMLKVEIKNQIHNIQCSPINKTLNLYFSFDIDIQPIDTYKSFKKIALNQKKLKRDSLGSSGIKIYGLNCMIVKSKEYPAEHLFCIAHQIPGSEGYIYLPYEIIPHQRYEELLNNKSELEKVANKARDLILILPEVKNTLRI